MGLGAAVARWLREQGHDTAHLSERGLSRLPDAEVLALAASEKRVLVTCDLDFGEILALSGASTVSVVLFRMANLRAGRVIERLGSALGACAGELERGAIVVVEESRLRVRLLPVGS